MASLLHRIIDYPPILDLMRRIIEANFRAEKKVIARELGSNPGSLLDLPCGTGLFSPLFPDSDYTGVDLGEKYVQRAQKKFLSKKFLVGDALNLAFPDAHFDAVLTIGFLHHLDEADIVRSLSEIHRVLKPGGKFLLIEDCPTRSKWNFLGRFLQSQDAGGRIRPMAYYEQVLLPKFTLEKSYPMRAGVWDYGIFLLQSKV